MTAFEPIGEGDIARLDPDGHYVSASGPRCVVAGNGELVCSFMISNGNGINDFIPVLAFSRDEGRTWSEANPVWPGLTRTDSLFCSLSKAPDGTLFLYGTRTPIERPGEKFWQASNQGIKRNELFWARSGDHGRTWTQPHAIPLPAEASAEAPGPLCVTRNNEWLAVFAPYNTFDEAVRVQRNRIVLLVSRDEGQTWSHTDMLRFDNEADGGAESWIVELGNGSLLGASWHFNYASGEDYANAFAMSDDGGATWSAASSTGTMGQSVALAAYGEDCALFVYNRRKSDNPGIGLALARPRPERFELLRHELAWQAASTTKSDRTDAGHNAWENFSFGEPAVCLLPDGTLLLVFWFSEAGQSGVRYLRLAVADRA